MANINGHINRIRTATYGQEVRGSLADGLKVVNQEIEAATRNSEDTKTKQMALEQKYNSQIANMTLDTPSAAEIVDLRISTLTGLIYDTAGRRVDAMESDVKSRDINVRKYEHMKVAVAGGYDWAPVIQKAIDECFASVHGDKRRVIDLFGDEFMLASPIQMPAGRNLTLKNGHLKAHESFPSWRHMIELNKRGAQGTFANQDLIFVNLQFDCNFRGGALALERYNRVVVNFCRFFHFTSEGLLLTGYDSHEAIVTNCFFQEILWDDPDRENRAYTGTAMNVQTNDNHFSNNILAYSNRGIVVSAQYNLFHCIHIWGTKDLGLYVPKSGAYNSFSQMYFDSVQILIEDPWHLEITNSKFLHSTKDKNFAFIILKPTRPGIFTQGFKLTGNSFVNNKTDNQATTVKAISVDGSMGSFSGADVRQTVIDDNSFSDCKPAYSRYQKTVYLTETDTWTTDFADTFPFGAIQKVLYTFKTDSGGYVQNWLNKIDENKVVVKTDKPATGTVWVYADINMN